MTSEEFDDEVLETVVTRREILEQLSDEPHHRRELQEVFDISKTTCHRIIRSLDDKGLVRRTDRGYDLSELGKAVTEQVGAFDRTVRAAYRLEPLLDAFATADVEFDIELFADASVTEPRPEDPSPPINRYLELFRAADRIRTVDRTSFIPPLYVEEIFELSLEGNKTGLAIYPRSVVEQRFADYPEIHRRAIQQDRAPIYRVYEGVPFGLTIYDSDHVAVRAYDDETGNLVLFVDTDEPDAVAWATDVFDHYYEQSDLPSALEELPE